MRKYSKRVVFIWPRHLRELPVELLSDPSQLYEGARLIDTTGNIRRVLSLTETHAWLTHKHGGLGKEQPIVNLIKWGNKIIIEK